MIRFKCFLTLFALLASHLLMAQSSEEELAAQYFSEKSYDKAVILYKKLHKKNPASVYVYQNYLSSLINLNELDEAESMIEKVIKKYPSNQIYYVDLGEVFRLKGDEKKRQAIYQQQIDRLSSNPIEIEQLANAFLKYNLFSQAETVIFDGRKLTGIPTQFHELLVQIMYSSKSYTRLIDECLMVLKYEPSLLENVKQSIVLLVDQDIEMDYLQEKSMMYVQKNPQNQAFDDLLMWVFIQQKKFTAAFRHSVSIDKRTKGDGKGVFELAKICKDNKDYEAAEKCYQYLIDRGTDNFYYVNAKMGLLESSYAKMRMNPLVSDPEIQSIVIAYNSFLTDFGRDWNTAGSMKELADIYLFYLHDLNKGMSVLTELVNIPRLKPNQRAEYKLALADAYVIKGEVWEATLLYGQVDKEFKEDPLGQEAKFRNARLSYFRGDFEWAKDQLDILKTATSQLISNNAIELALLIQDNTGLDSTTEALGEYAHAQLLLFQNKLDECLEVLNMLPFKYPNHSLEDEIYFSKAQVMEAKKDFLKAETYYLSVIELFPEDILADNAVYSLAKLYELKLNDQKKAADMYEKLLFDYTGSLFAVDARKRYKKIQEILEASPVSP